MRCLGRHASFPQVAVLAALAALLVTGVIAAGAGAAPNPDTQTFGVGTGTRATGLTSGPDGNLWFIGPTSGGEGSGDVVGRLTPEGAVTRFPLPATDSGGGEITAGPDGNLWFTEPSANSVGRISTAGEIDLFALPSPAAAPGAIVAGPGGALWFVEEAADKVGRVDASGSVAEFPLPSGARPTGIAEGSDGALWIVEKGLGKIARMAPSGVVTDQYPLPDANSLPHAIVNGPGDQLWFSEEGGAHVGRISAAGEIEEFRVPGGLGTRELALGSDGNLWFTTGFAIGSISASGETGEPECIDGSCRYPINALTKGPEGELWFATDIREAEGGSGAQQLALSDGGLIGKFFAPTLSVRLGKRATRVDDGLTSVSLSCHGGTAGEACRGFLRLTTRLPRGRGRSGKATVLLDQHRYRMAPATSRQLPLRLGGRGQRALAKSRRLKVEISATLFEANGARRDFHLRARRRG